MKITKEEKMYLERCGYGRKDFAQIQEATRRDKTTYEMDGAPMETLLSPCISSQRASPRPFIF